MEMSLYFANEKMQMVCGEYKGGQLYIDTYASLRLPEGSLINGVITDDHIFVQAVKELISERSDLKINKARVAIGSSKILNKTMVVPRLPQKKLLDWMRGEFTEMVLPGQKMLYDYRILDSNAEGDFALLCAVDEAMVGSYIDALDEAGVGISCIDTAINCQIKLMDLLRPQGETYAVLALDGNNMDAVLYMNGRFSVSNKVRFFNDRGTPEISGEVERTISNLIQFNDAQKNDQRISTIYLCGARNNERFLYENIMGAFDLQPQHLNNLRDHVESADAMFVTDDYLYTAGNLV